MRPVMYVLLIALVAWGVSRVLSDQEPRIRQPASVPEPAPETDEHGRPIARHATLVVHLIGPDRKHVEHGDVGTENGGAVRWAAAGRDGIRTYTDMEPGPVRILGRAAGRIQSEQTRHLTAGVRTEVRLVLRPEK